MKNVGWIVALLAGSAASTLFADEPVPENVRSLAKGLVAEDWAEAQKAADSLAALGWPVVRQLEILKASKFLPEAERVAFEPRAEEVQGRVEEETWRRCREAGKAFLDRESAETHGGTEGWRITDKNFGNALTRSLLRDHVIFTKIYWWRGKAVMPPTMGKLAVRVSTGECLHIDDDPSPLFRAEGFKPESPEAAARLMELFNLLTLDEQFDLARGFAEGLGPGGCRVLEKASDVPVRADKPLSEDLVSAIAPPSTRAIDGGFETTACLWYKLGGRIVRRTLTFQGGTIGAKSEVLAERVGAFGFKR